MAAYLTTALVVAAASAFQLLQGRPSPASRTALRMAVGLIAIVAPLQIVFGDTAGVVMRKYQPMKTAAVEAIWKTGAHQPFGWPPFPTARPSQTISSSRSPSSAISSSMLPPTSRSRAWTRSPRRDQPPVFVVFWSFRPMVGLGLLMIALGLWGSWLVAAAGGCSRPV